MIALLLPLLAATTVAASEDESVERWALRERGAKSGATVVACLTKTGAKLGWVSELHAYTADYQIEGDRLKIGPLEDDYDGRWEPALGPFESDWRAVQNRLDDVLRGDPRISLKGKVMVLRSDDGVVLKLKRGGCE